MFSNRNAYDNSCVGCGEPLDHAHKSIYCKDCDKNGEAVKRIIAAVMVSFVLLTGLYGVYWVVSFLIHHG